MRIQHIVRLALTFILVLSLLFTTGCFDSGNIGSGSVITEQSQNCNFSDNLDESADSFISRCRKASIRREFPGDYYGKTLGEIDRDRSKDGKKARKLLNDRRFEK